MPKRIAVLSYDLNPASLLTTDAVVVQNFLNASGYTATLVHQWRLDETNAAMFFSAAEWLRLFDGIVICEFYDFWNLREVILSKLPVLCLNSGYVDDLGLGEQPVTHASENECKITINTHPITLGLALGVHNTGNPVYADSVSTFDHNVQVLATTLVNNAVLVAHKTHKLIYFGWYQMSKASPGSLLFHLLKSAAAWAF